MTLPLLEIQAIQGGSLHPQFFLAGVLEPVGSLMPYLNNADRNDILLKQVSATPIDPAFNMPTFAAEELWLPRKEMIAVRFLDTISSDTMPLLSNKEKVRIFLPHIVIQATFSRGADTKIHEVFDVLSGDWATAVDAQIYPMHPMKCQFGRDAQMVLIIKRYSSFTSTLRNNCHVQTRLPRSGEFLYYAGDVFVKSYYFPKHQAAGKAVLQASAQAIQVFSEKFGPPPHPTLSAVEADFDDGMEFSGPYILGSEYYASYDGTAMNYATLARRARNRSPVVV